MKKTVCFLLIPLLVFALFACGKTEGAPPAADETAGSVTDGASPVTADAYTENESAGEKIKSVEIRKYGEDDICVLSGEEAEYIGGEAAAYPREEVTFGGSKDYVIEVNGKEYFYDAGTGEAGNGDVVRVKDKDKFNGILRRYLGPGTVSPDGKTRVTGVTDGETKTAADTSRVSTSAHEKIESVRIKNGSSIVYHNLSGEEAEYVGGEVAAYPRAQVFFSGSKDYVIEVNGEEYFYDAGTGEAGNSSVVYVRDRDKLNRILHRHLDPTAVSPGSDVTVKNIASGKTSFLNYEAAKQVHAVIDAQGDITSPGYDNISDYVITAGGKTYYYDSSAGILTVNVRNGGANSDRAVKLTENERTKLNGIIAAAGPIGLYTD